MLLAAETWSPMIPLGVYATLPLWPLVGAAIVGFMLLGKPRDESPAGDAHGGQGHDSHGDGGDTHDSHGHSDSGGVLDRAHWPVVLGVGIAALMALVLFWDLSHLPKPAAAGHGDAVLAGEHAVGQHAASGEADGARAAGGTAHALPGVAYTAYNWISLGQDASLANQWIGVTLYFDGLTGVMMLVVCVVSLMVVLYSIGYMRDHHWHPERGYERFFAFLALFVFSMSMLVLGGNFILLYLGWELVGLCSYLLIGFYYKRPAAAAAAKKAFIVNRIGDFGFALGIFAIYYFLAMGHAGVTLAAGENPFDYTTVFRYADVLAHTPAIWGMNAADLISLLLLCGAIGKSAQLPLYVWLPDAMEGPSPVSALIHAATMVTAGVYMVARCGPLYAFAPTTMVVIAVIGALGALFAATMAMAQYDMKRIMAYSTMSQLAYMFVALACAAPDAAIFHLYTHAFFKALLFLTAGNVMHAMGNVIDLRQFSGLRHVLPTTFWLMGIGCLALAGFPFLAGFWSKDTILHAAFFSPMAHKLPWLGWVMMITAGLTAYYSFRMFFLCFNGPQRLPKEAEHAHEMPAAMQRPLYVLAVGAVAAGYLGVWPKAGSTSFLGVLYPHGYFHEYLGASSIVLGGHEAGAAWVMYLAILLGLGGIGLAFVRYGAAPQDEPDRQALGAVWDLWHAKYYVDELYQRIFVAPLRRVGEACFGTDRFGINGLLYTIAALPTGAGFLLRFMQQGALQAYALAMMLGVGVLLLVWNWVERGT